MQLASKIKNQGHRLLQSDRPLTDAQIMQVAPSVFAPEPHASRSKRYGYVPTIDVLDALRKEGFMPFMVCQAGTRVLDKTAYTKHMLRLRRDQRDNRTDGQEVNDIILLNSHDGSSAYQMLAGCFRFVCANGMVCGDIDTDLRLRHSGHVVDDVIDGAFRVLEDFELVDAQKDAMKSLSLNRGEQQAFAHAALELRYEPEQGQPLAAPITEEAILAARRPEDTGPSLWTTFNRVQENLVQGGLKARSATNRRLTTRPIHGIDQNVKLNKALWTLASEMGKLKAAA